MTKPDLDESVEAILKEENPTAEAVKSLINVKEREAGKDSEVELKTDLSDDEIKIHTVLSIMSGVLEMTEEDFNKKCILSDVIEKKERKALSKDRKSRLEIVEVARQPNISMGGAGLEEGQHQGFLKRMFTSRKKKEDFR